MTQQRLAREVLDLLRIMDECGGGFSHEIATFVSEVLGVPHAMGCSRTAYLFDDFVVKVSHLDKGRILIPEYGFIRKMRLGKHKKHFPKTRIMRYAGRMALIQERIPSVGSTRSYAHEIEVAQLGKTLDIDDVNGDNYGWKGSTPVFVDVAERFSYHKENA